MASVSGRFRVGHLANFGDSKISTGDRRAVSAPNWPKIRTFQSPPARGVRKVPEFRGFFPETGDP
jgi:hypothetical protein